MCLFVNKIRGTITGKCVHISINGELCPLVIQIPSGSLDIGRNSLPLIPCGCRCGIPKHQTVGILFNFGVTRNEEHVIFFFWLPKLPRRFEKLKEFSNDRIVFPVCLHADHSHSLSGSPTNSHLSFQALTPVPQARARSASPSLAANCGRDRLPGRVPPRAQPQSGRSPRPQVSSPSPRRCR